VASVALRRTLGIILSHERAPLNTNEHKNVWTVMVSKSKEAGEYNAAKSTR